MRRSSNELNPTTYEVYLYIVSVKESVVPREIMHAKNIRSPSVIQRHLQKLSSWGWVTEDAYGRFSAAKRVNFKGYFWVGKRLLPNSILALLCLIAVAVAFGLAFFNQGLTGPINGFHIVLLGGMVLSGSFLLAEVLRQRTLVPKEGTPA